MVGGGKKILVTSIFSFSINVFNPVREILFICVILSSAVFRENPRYCYSLGVVFVVVCSGVIITQKLSDFVISLLLLKILTCYSEYVFTIQRSIHTIKGDNSIFFSEIHSFLDSDFLSSIRNPAAKSWHLHMVLVFNLSSAEAFILTHYQTTNMRLFQTERVCRRQF